MKKLVLLALCLASLTGKTNAQSLVKNIASGSSGSVDTTPPLELNEFLLVNNAFYFIANDNTAIGEELYRSDGTEAGTVLVKDIAPGSYKNSFVRYMAELNGKLYFSAGSDGNNYTYELWQSDGTEAGTTLLKEIHPGTTGSMPSELTQYNGALYFAAHDGVTGRELWRTDGTAAGTVLVKDAYAGSSSSDAQKFTVANGLLFFYAEVVGGFRLWKSDGTTAGTSIVKPNLRPSQFTRPVVVGNTLYFVASYNDNTGGELWKTDGTEAGTVMVKDIYTGNNNSSSPDYLTAAGNELYFFATDGTHGHELWKTDGTTAGTVMVKDINPGSGSSMNNQSPDYNTTAYVNGTFFFRAADGTTGAELWKSDGTAAGTTLLKDIHPGSSGSLPAYLLNYNGTVFFQATDYSANGGGKELYKTDGTPAGTELASDIYPGGSGSTPAPLVTHANGFYLYAAAPSVGHELFTYPGTVNSAEPVVPGNLVTAYPNPAANLLFLNSEVEMPVTILNTLGQEVWSGTISQNKPVGINHLASGVYLVRLNSTLQTIKLIKQ